MDKRRPSIVPLSLVTLALFIAALACGPTGGGASPTNPAPTAEKPSGGTPTRETSSAGGAVSSLEDVKSATIQIVAQGSFADPAIGVSMFRAGFGSGFIIDSSGIAVTNNHVVAGSGLVQVWVGGNSQDLLNAKVVGVAECSDLAVIDIEGDGFPFLEWHEGPIPAGLDVYAAGFPLGGSEGNREFTVTRGVISKEEFSGQFSFAAVRSFVEFDANVNPGNSGGPLVDEDGRVVAVVSASDRNTGRSWGVSRKDALPIVEQLRSGADVSSIGINGEAVANEDGSLTGIWVSSVASGSAADKAGLQPADIITVMEGVSLGADGTMGDYCDILRTHDAGDTLAIEVVNFSTGEFLTGQLNGDPLVTSFTFSTDVGTEAGTPGEAYSEYTAWTDNLGSIQVEVPTSWVDVDGTPYTDANGADFASIWASPNLDDFKNTWGTPGVMFNVTADKEKVGGHIQMLDRSRSSAIVQDCTLDQRYDYNDGVYRGAFDYYNRCGGSTDYMILSAVPIQSGTNVLIFVEIQIVSQADLDAADRILATFDIVGNLP